MTRFITHLSLGATFALLVLFLGLAAPAVAQDTTLLLSKDRNFLTDDHAFDREDTLFVLATIPAIDYTNLDKNELRLKPDDGGNDRFASFENHLDGRFSLALPLADTDASEADWEVRIDLRDRFGVRLERRIDITIGRNGNGGGDDSDDEIEFKGFIEALTENTIAVGGVLFQVDGSTDVLDRDNDPIAFASLAVGEFIEIRADRAAAGGWLASRIKLDDSFSDDEVEFTGKVDFVSADSIVVNGVTFLISSTTSVLDDDRSPISILDIVVGQVVEIRGERSGNGSLTATNVKIEDDFSSEDEIEFTGVVEAIGEASITVNGTVFTVDDATVVTDHANQPIVFAVLVVGETVEIKGYRQADGSVRAVRIHREDRGEDEVELTGLIESIDAGSLVVSGLTFVTNELTVILDNNRNPIVFADLAVGMVVEIRADVQPGGALLATDIKIEDRLEDEVEVRGVVDSVGDSTMVVLGQSFRILPATVFVDNNGATIGLEAFSAGSIAEIRATLQPGGLIVALHVQEENDDASRIEVRGPVSAVGATSLAVVGIELAWDGATLFFDRDNNAVDATAIQVGQGVKVFATAQENALPLANRVEIKSPLVVSGKLTAVDGAQLTLGGATFQLSESVLVLGRFNVVMPNAQLEVGQVVELSASLESGVAAVTTVRLLVAAAVGTDVEEGRSLPSVFTLHGNYPNPFNPTTTIVFDLSGPAQVDIQVYDLLGRRVMALPAEAFEAGASRRLSIDATDLASGIYLYRLTARTSAGPVMQTGRMTLIK